MNTCTHIFLMSISQRLSQLDLKIHEVDHQECLAVDRDVGSINRKCNSHVKSSNLTSWAKPTLLHLDILKKSNFFYYSIRSLLFIILLLIFSQIISNTSLPLLFPPSHYINPIPLPLFFYSLCHARNLSPWSPPPNKPEVCMTLLLLPLTLNKK
jgi:hypothetical protein